MPMTHPSIYSILFPVSFQKKNIHSDLKNISLKFEIHLYMEIFVSLLFYSTVFTYFSTKTKASSDIFIE